ncbi:DUF4143 domain-containing protein [Nocardia sp. NPDC005366]|uniref:DUF4143 domain-containing protein n=1 Tax=Nocardia sp. NPDC005366 TaxID=3156878 RepID=UPI0033A14321
MAGLPSSSDGRTPRFTLQRVRCTGQGQQGFVLMELARQLNWASEGVSLFHYRTKDRVEVDAVLENRRGEVGGIEVNAASTVCSDDFRHLAERLGDDFIVRNSPDQVDQHNSTAYGRAKAADTNAVTASTTIATSRQLTALSANRNFRRATSAFAQTCAANCSAMSSGRRLNSTMAWTYR